MNDLIQSLLSAVETREIDMAECSPVYAGAKFGVRVNWTRAHKKHRYTLMQELAAILETDEDHKSRRKAKAKIEDSEIDTLNKRSDEYSANITKWWAVVFMMEPEEVETVRDALSPPHWDWLTGAIIKAVNEYEATETKKALALRGLSSEEPARKCPNCGTELPLQDG